MHLCHSYFHVELICCCRPSEGMTIWNILIPTVQTHTASRRESIGLEDAL